MYEVIRMVRGNAYRYLQESYRENGKVKTRYEYLGPVNPKRKKSVLSAIGELLGEVNGLARTHKPWEETEEQALDRAAKQAAEYHLNDWMREKLLKEGATLAEIDLIARYQHGELKLTETSHRHWELMPPATEERTVHAPALVETKDKDSPAYSAAQEAEQRQTDFMLGEGASSEAVAAPEPSGGDTPPSEPAQPSEPTGSAVQE